MATQSTSGNIQGYGSYEENGKTGQFSLQANAFYFNNADSTVTCSHATVSYANDRATYEGEATIQPRGGRCHQGTCQVHCE
jgi:hypothetical protein